MGTPGTSAYNIDSIPEYDSSGKYVIQYIQTRCKAEDERAIRANYNYML